MTTTALPNIAQVRLHEGGGQDDAFTVQIGQSHRRTGASPVPPAFLSLILLFGLRRDLRNPELDVERINDLAERRDDTCLPYDRSDCRQHART